LHCLPAGPADAIVQPPRRPVDFLRLAETPLFAGLGGNPAQLVNAAARLGLAPPANNALPRSFSADASAGPCRPPTSPEVVETVSSGGLLLSTRRRVRLLRPDGRSRDEWLPRAVTISQVLEDFCPKGLSGSAAIFVADCYAPPDALLGDFPEDETAGLLVLEFRSNSLLHNDW